MNNKDLTYHVSNNTTLDIGNKYIIKQRNKEINDWINGGSYAMIIAMGLPLAIGLSILYLLLKYTNIITTIIIIPILISAAIASTTLMILKTNKKLKNIHDKYGPHITEVTIPATLNKDIINSVDNEKREILANKFLEFKENPSNELADDIAHTIDLLASV